MKVNLQITARCSECGDIMWGEGCPPFATVFCSNVACSELNIKYKVPAVELERAE